MQAFDGTLFSRKQAEEFINDIPSAKLAWVKHLTVHNTGAPNMKQEDTTPDRQLPKGGEDDRMRNIKPYYAKWGYRGPHLFTFNSGMIGLGTVLPAQGVHSPSWNKTSIGVEMVADFRKGVDDPYIGGGLMIVDTTAWLFATILKKLGLPATSSTIRLHKEDKATTHDCPGDLFKKDDFVKRVQEYMGVVTKPTIKEVTPAPIFTQKVMQPGGFMYSDYCRNMLKKIEALRLKAYWDAGSWAIGYGHNATSQIKPIPYEGMTCTTEQAEQWLEVDMVDKLRYLNTWVKVPLNQGYVDALVIFMFQQGPGNFKKKLLPTVNAKMHWTVAKMLDNWVHANAGVVRRRKFEADVYRGNQPTKW